MPSIRPSTDVLPVTEFRANTSAMLTRMHASRRPVILTQHGRGTAVVMDVEVYEGLLDEMELLRDLHIAESQIARGEGIPHEQVVAELRERLLG
ncbi:MAG: prevent-host-death family protein [Actinobacteria bacterium HGW-Actinobacteria-10]|nr:MAG: prevent-host-death family protein [Actinobacteria bacterium HGW-Actinobacteria-10]